MQIADDAIDCVLIDDDALVRLMWQVAAESTGKRLLALAGGAEFWPQVARLTAAVPIYIDYSLRSQPSGDQLAQQIAAAGFTNIFFQTGHHLPATATEAKPWLRGIVGKDPPWL